MYIIKILKYGIVLWEDEDACDKLLRAGDEGTDACFIIIRDDNFLPPLMNAIFKSIKQTISQFN